MLISMKLVLAYKFSNLISYCNIVHRPVLPENLKAYYKNFTTGNIVTHSAQYLNHYEEIMYIVMNHS